MKKLLGVGREDMPDIAFSFMAFGFKLRDMFFPVDQFVTTLGIQQGFTLIDYGCGPGSYINKTSELVGTEGTVYAVDIHELAIQAVRKRIGKCQLSNVEPLLATGYSCPLNEQVADVILALDMFHMIEEPMAFLKELHRLLKRDGFLIIDDGHQSRDEAKAKIKKTNIWNIESENKKYLKCRPIQG
jgi:ubiquinone/menaquinone biosynthesis C-methylase UbiE